MTDLLQVFLHDADIGTLSMLPSGKTFFSLNEKYMHDSDRQVLSQSFFRASGELIPETKASSVKLPAFFSNLLPEGHMRNYLAQLGNVKPTAEFKLIELLGEDFAQVYNVYPEKKYEGVSYGNIAHMVWTLTGECGLKDFIRRLAFTILIVNGEMHLKNWSFIYRDGKTAALSPAYDLLSTIPYLPNDKLALKLYNTRNMQNITLEHFRKLTQKSQLPQHMVLQVVRETVDATITLWKENRRHFALPADLFACIDKHILGNNLRAMGSDLNS